jgi:hypothetical protein
MITPREFVGFAWNGVNNSANFDDLPRDVIANFVQNGATTFQRPGWLLVDRAQPEDWLDLFRLAYVMAEERASGSYAAYRLVPK